MSAIVRGNGKAAARGIMTGWLDEPLNRSSVGPTLNLTDSVRGRPAVSVVHFVLSTRDTSANRSLRNERQQVAPHAPHTEEEYRRTLKMRSRGLGDRNIREAYGEDGLVGGL